MPVHRDLAAGESPMFFWSETDPPACAVVVFDDGLNPYTAVTTLLADGPYTQAQISAFQAGEDLPFATEHHLFEYQHEPSDRIKLATMAAEIILAQT